MKKYLFGIIIVIAITAIALVTVRIITGEDTWICENGQWVKHGYPTSPKPTSECVPSSTELVPAKQEDRKITGKFTYPPDIGPIDMTVCAKKTDSEQEYCTFYPAKQHKGSSEVEYQIKLFPGSYLVYAFDYNNRSTAAFYTNYVKCGMADECTDHDNVIVTVPQFSDVQGIDPIDWEEYLTKLRLRSEDEEYKAANPLTPDDVDLGAPPD